MRKCVPGGVSVRSACVRRGVAVRERVLGEGWLWEHEFKTGDGGGTATKKNEYEIEYRTKMKTNMKSKNDIEREI